MSEASGPEEWQRLANEGGAPLIQVSRIIYIEAHSRIMCVYIHTHLEPVIYL